MQKISIATTLALRWKSNLQAGSTSDETLRSVQMCFVITHTSICVLCQGTYWNQKTTKVNALSRSLQVQLQEVELST